MSTAVRRGARLSPMVCAVVLALLFSTGQAALADPYAGVQARLTAPVTTVYPGKPVWVQFTITNTTDAPVVLSVPDAAPDATGQILDLPETHIFSGVGFAGLTVRGDYDRVWKDAQGYTPPTEAPELVLAPHALVGREMDISQFYPALESPGIYRIVWQPYGGLVTSNQLTIEVAHLKQAEIITDDGVMTVQLFYDLAPNHVANIIELARDGFYDQKTFHRIEPGYFIQGGCPNGDGSGIRPDGKKLTAEFSDFPVDQGTVCMARLESDPNSASCQFLIANTRMPAWDGRYTVFGHLIGDASQRTLEKLMAREVDAKTGRPSHALYIRSVRIVDAPAPDDIAGARGGGFAETDR